MANDIWVAGVCERDVDLLMLEEFQASSLFRTWFLDRTAKNAGAWIHYGGARRSVTQSSGESDLEVQFSDKDGSRLRLMIENKVGAGLQPAQAQRYRERGGSYIARGECDFYRTVIVAPQRYFGVADSMKGFDARVLYEDVLQWFLDAEDLGERRIYKASLLRSAIDKGTLGYQPEIDGITSAFWRRYWELAKIEAPDLEMPEPSRKPSGAGFVWFRPPSLPQGVTICHKLNYGCVDLQFSGMGARLNELEAEHGPYLEADMQLVRATKSGAVRLAVPTLRSNQVAANQEGLMIEGIRSANRLLYWYRARSQL